MYEENDVLQPREVFTKPTCEHCGVIDYQRGRLLYGEWTYYCPFCKEYDSTSQAHIDKHAPLQGDLL